MLTMPEDELPNKPLYYSFLRNLLKNSRINPEIQEDVLDQYVQTPNDFESDFAKMHRYLLFMNLRPTEAQEIALKFHSQINNISERDLMDDYGVQGSYRGYEPRKREREKEENSNSMIDIKDMLRLKQEMEIIKSIFDDGPKQQPVQQQQDPMAGLLMPMMMMASGMQVRGEMEEGPNGQPRFKGFSLVPQQQSQSQGNDFVQNILGKVLGDNNQMQQMLYQNLYQEKDQKIAELEQKINWVASKDSTEETLQDFKKWLNFQQSMGIGGTGGGDLQSQIELQKMRQQHDLAMEELKEKRKNSDFNRELALREFQLGAEEKKSQRDISKEALSAISNNVSNVISKVAGPATQQFIGGMAEASQSQQPQQPSQGQRPPQQSQQSPDFDNMTDDQLLEAKRKAQEIRANSELAARRMSEYEQEFDRRLGERQQIPDGSPMQSRVRTNPMTQQADSNIIGRVGAKTGNPPPMAENNPVPQVQQSQPKPKPEPEPEYRGSSIRLPSRVQSGNVSKVEVKEQPIQTEPVSELKPSEPSSPDNPVQNESGVIDIAEDDIIITE